MNSSSPGATGRPIPRRRFLLGLPAVALEAQQASGKGQTFPSDAKRYADAATEFPVVRLTSPEYSSHLSAYHNRTIAGRSVLYFSADRTGRLEIFRADLRNGQTRQLTSAEHLDPTTLALPPGDRSLLYCDGPAVEMLTISNLKEREIYRVPEGWERAPGFSASADGSRVLLIERSGSRHRIRSISLRTGPPATLVEADESLSDPIPRPGSDEFLFRRGGAIWVGGPGNSNSRKLALSPGEALSPFWSPDGNSLLYLNVSPDRGQLNTIRELNLPSTTNRLVSKTSQFVAMGANADASVFVGASGSKASPHVLILIRSVQRELTMCEHRAKDPHMVAPVFAPSSQRIVFASDQHGKPAIYTMSVERFVEETES
jgi:oligogalacturonide lyase